MSELVVIVGNPRAGSRTRAAAEQAAGELAHALTANGVPVDGVRVIELADAVAVSFSSEPATAAAPDPGALDAVRAATLLLVASPAYKGTFTGLLKIFLDQLPHQGLAGVVAVPIAIAGAPAHVASTALSLTTLLTELGAGVPGSIGVLDGELADSSIVSARARELAPAVLTALTAPVG